MDDPAVRAIAAEEVRRQLSGVPDAVIDTLVEMQVAAKFADLEARYADASVEVMSVDGEAVAYVISDHRDDVVRLCDIAVVPAARGRGHGRVLLAELLRRADAAGAAVELSVWHDAPARYWYQRHGFRVVGGDPHAYLEMRRECPGIHSVA